MTDTGSRQSARILVRDSQGGRGGEISRMVREVTPSGCTPAAFRHWEDAARAAATDAYEVAVLDVDPAQDPRDVHLRIKALRRAAPRLQIIAVHRGGLATLESDLRNLGVIDVVGGEELQGPVLRRAIRLANERLRLAQDESRRVRRVQRTEDATAVLEGIRHPVLGIANDGQVVFANRAAGRMLMCLPEELPGRGILGFVKVEHRIRLARVLERSRQGFSSGGTECRFAVAHRASRWMSVDVTPWRRGGRELPGSLIVAHDVGERQVHRLADAPGEEDLQAALASILDTLPIGILIADRTGRPKLVNRVARELLGMNALVPVSRWPTMDLLFSADGAPVSPQTLPILQTLEDGIPRREVRMQIGRPGTLPIPVLLNTNASHDPDGHILEVCCTFTNITEQRNVEEQLHQAQKISEISGLVGGVAHDFNNMLCAIMGYADLLDAASQDPARTEHIANEIRKAGDRAAVLTRQLLTFSRRESKQERVFNMNTTVQDMEGLLRRLINEDICLLAELDPDLPNIRGDAGRIGQVVLNLAVNARDAMPTGGDLHITTCLRQIRSRELDGDPSVKPGPYVVLNVRDTGVGMGEDVLSRIFEPFFTTKGRNQGTGLGLSTVYDIVQKAHGHIRVESELGVGTEFQIYLPAILDAETEIEEVARPSPMSAGAQEVILLVEDEPMVRALVREILEIQDYVVMEAANGTQALELCAQNGDAIQAVITDVVMPEMSGRELAERVRAICPGVPILFVSGYTDDALLRYGVTSGEAPFLQKPFAPGELTHLLARLLEARESNADDVPADASRLRSA